MMQNNSTVTNRYSDTELDEFQILIEKKIEDVQQQFDSLSQRVENISETSGNDGDWMDDSSNMQDLDMLNAMMGRHRKHIQDLENALMRVKNKRYGICVVSGQLIDKRRLMAVLTTTKSIAAKNTNVTKDRFEAAEKRKSAAPKKPKSFSRIIKKTSETTSDKPKTENDNFFDDEDNDLDLDLGFDENNIIDDSMEIIE